MNHSRSCSCFSAAFAVAFLAGAFVLGPLLSAQTGPYDPESWPTTRDAGKRVHYVVTDGGLTAPSDTWQEGSLAILTGGDQVTQDIAIGGHTGKKVTGNFLNVADGEFTAWAGSDFIDILVQVYGDAALLNEQGQPRDFVFLTGTLPELNLPVGGQIAVEAKNKRWNWVLFRIPNGYRPSDGSHYIGSIPANAQGGFQSGGVNGGTIRFEGVPGLIVRVVAFGEEGAFGTIEDINQFLPAETCAPEPATNLASLDVATDTSDHMVVINAGDQTVTFENQVGPAGDQRRAVRPNGVFLNFGITDNYLGSPCNDPRAVKVCVDFYDAPEFAGMEVRFGPEAYATDDKGGIGIYPPENRHLMEGSGKWVRRSWTVAAVNLKGVNAGALTAGPRFVSDGQPVFVSRIALAVLRTGTHPLAGQDPLADCYVDPKICTDAYGNFVELDLAKDIKNGLDLGTSGGDQEMIVAKTGPAADQRMAVRPAREDGIPGFGHQYLNFAIINEALGPNSQPPARLAICVTYYDDPLLAGARFKPEVYITERAGSPAFGWVPDSAFVTLEGTDQWRQAYWEVPDVKFNGVNQAPQAATRFVVTDKIFVTSVRYAVIRPCGPLAGVNLLESCNSQPAVSLGIARVDNRALLSWPAASEGFALEETTSLTNPQWTPTAGTPELQADRWTLSVPVDRSAKFFRLSKP